MTTVNDLVTKIREASIAYYTGNAIISDRQFDNLIDELKALDPENPTLKTIGWGYKPNRDAVKHKYLVGSLQKIKDSKDIPFKGKRIITLKYDGLTGSAFYKNGELVQVLSRGSGMEGQDITPHCYSFLPHKIDYKDEIYVRGEIVIKRKTFAKYKEVGYANERNFISGLMNRIETGAEDKDCSFVTYSILGSTKPKLEQLSTLEKAGFEVADVFSDISFSSNITTEENFENIFRSNTEYLTDGLVITENETLEEIAYKFEDESKVGIVDHVEWNVGTTGRMIPVVVLKEPLDLEGTKVTRATAVHATFIKENQIGEDTKLEIAKANKIIPHIEKVAESSVAILPIECPRCNSKLEWAGLDLCCMDESCIAKEEARLWELANIVGLPKGLAETTLNEWFKYVSGSSIRDLLLQDVTMAILEGGTHYNNLLNEFMINIDRKTKDGFTFSEFWQIMCIPGLGQEMANRLKDVAPRAIKDSFIYDTEGKALTQEELMGELSAGRMREVLNSVHSNVEMAINKSKYWREAYKWFKFKETKPTENQEQFQVVITGALFHYKRNDFEKLLKDKGIKLAKAVSKNTKYLITNDPTSGSNKNVAAQKLGVELITEEDFMKRYLG
jgi:DNA ligase (NAD+)